MTPNASNTLPRASANWALHPTATTRPPTASGLAAIASALLVALALLPAGASAQSIDYGALEQLFGEPVTTSVTGKPQRATDAPANIEIITQDDIRRSGATTIPEALQFLPGIDVRQQGLAGADVGMRGYNQPANPNIMVLIDGRQVYLVDYGRIAWASLPVQLDEIRQIEVIKGPNSALYGFNAVGGVINIITFDPLHDRVNAATVRAGTQNYASGSAVGTAKIGETAGVRLSLGGFRSGDFAPGPISRLDQATHRNPFTGTFSADGRMQVSPGTEAFAMVSAGDTRLTEPSLQSGLDTEELHTNSVRLGINAESGIGLLGVSAYRNETYLDGFAVAAFGPVSYHERQVTTVVQASDLVKLGTDHTVRLGLEYRENGDVSNVLTGAILNRILAASVMWDWQITPSLSLTNAVRIDHVQTIFSGTPSVLSGVTAAQYSRVSLTEPSFNSGAVWKVTPDDTLRFIVARGVELPTITHQALQLDPGQVLPAGFYGSPSVRPAIIQSAEIDYDRTIPAIASTVRTALFAQRTDDIMAQAFGGDVSFGPYGVPLFQAANIGYSTAAGLEVGIKGHAGSGWRWNVSYSLAATTDHTRTNALGIILSGVTYNRSAPQNVVDAGIGYSWDRWEADLNVRWQSSFVDYRVSDTQDGLQRVNVQNYVTANARIGFNVRENVTLALTGQQLNTSRLIRTAGAPVERRIIASVTVRF